MKGAKSLKLFLMILLLIVGCALSACSQTNDYVGKENANNQQQGPQDPGEVTPPPADELDYSLFEADGKCYIVFDDISVYSSEGKSEVSTLSFATMKEMKDAIKNGKLKDWQKRVIATSFAKDDVGIKAFSLESWFVPNLPVNGAVDSVIWSGESYSFSMTLDNGVFGMLHVYTPGQYADIFASDYENYFDKDTISVSETETLEDGKTVTNYSTIAARLMQVRYVLTDEARTFAVDKTYRYSEGEAGAKGSYDLTNITMYCDDGGKKYAVDLFGFVEEPTDAWLLTFGLSVYNDSDVAVK